MPDDATEAVVTPIRIPVSRGRAGERAFLRLLPGGLMLWLGIAVLGRLNFVPSGVSNRITDYGLAAVLIPVTVVGAVVSLYGLRWLIMALWPGDLSITADTDTLTLNLGPMGRRRFPANGLSIRYPFEMAADDDEAECAYEALLDPEVQMAEYLPQIRFGQELERLERTILLYSRRTERELADILRPFIEHTRRDPPKPASQEDAKGGCVSFIQGNDRAP